VRKLCGKCRKATKPSDVDLREVGLTQDDVKNRTIYAPGGCDACMGTGYRGRVGVFELLEMSPRMREMIFRGDSMEKLREEATVSGGMTTLQRDGLRKVMAGVRTVEEVLRITQRSDIG
jgi:type II secretory ATPase GspE/PulE/Tfp pilus assembly ATPase PilB-like protein